MNGLITGHRLSGGLVLKALLTSIFLFFILTYDFSGSLSTQEQTVFGFAASRLSSYGLKQNIYTLAVSTAILIWFSYFGETLFTHSVSLTVTAAVFGILNTSALFLFHTDKLFYPQFPVICIFIIIAFGWMIFFSYAARILLLIFEKISSTNYQAVNKSRLLNIFESRTFLFSFILILIGWSLWIISYYPASMDWDVYQPIKWFLDNTPNNSHPWFYACTVGSAYQFGVSIGNKNFGIFIYTLIRAIIMAAIYARAVLFQKKQHVPILICFLTAVFFAFTPVWGAYAKHAFKDPFAAALFCWYMITLVTVVCETENRNNSVFSCLEYSASVLFSSLFRNDTVYVIIPATLILIFIILKRTRKIRFPILLLLGFLLFYSYQYYIFNIAGVVNDGKREPFSIPFQQTARTVKYHSDTITEEEKAVIGRCLDYDRLAEAYDPIISDPVKNTIVGTVKDGANYLIVWAKMFFKYPDTYIEAFISQNSGYYAFIPEYTEAQRYGPGPHINVGMTIFNWIQSPGFDPDFCCTYNENTGWLRSALDDWAKLWHQIPLLNLTDTIALYTWSIVLIGWLLIQRKDHIGFLPVSACLLMIIFCLFSPVNDCFRYYARVAAAFPVILTLLTRGKVHKEQEMT